MTEQKTFRILAIDVGSVRVGFALSDELQITAQPLEVLPRKPKKQLVRRIREIVQSQDVGEIVVGLPVNLQGEDTESTRDARSFAALMETTFPGIPIILRDERLTTTASENMLIDAGMRRDRRRRVIDKIAAAMILDAYLQFRRRQTLSPEDAEDVIDDDLPPDE